MAVLLAGLWACQPRASATAPGEATGGPAPPAENIYHAPPAVTAVEVEPGGGVRLTGNAVPGDQVRLAPPAGQPMFAVAGRDGVWRIALASSAEPRLFGLAMVDHGRAVQAEGYVALTPGGGAAQLRAGAGAVVLAGRAETPVLLAADYDSKGGTVISGLASPRASLDLMVDGVRRARGRAGDDGAFSLPLDEPLGFADHQVQVVDGVRRGDAVVTLSPGQPFSARPYRATRAGSGWRIDWMTPGGGLQTTLLLNQNRSVS